MSERHIELQDDIMVKISDWKEQIKQSLEPFVEIVKEYGIHKFTNPDTDLEVGPLSVIWEMSTEAFDIPREIQIVIDDDGEIFIDVGTPGYVDFSFEPSGMKLPIMCWIHTHPFGQAFFSGTDWKTIKSWKGMMQSATVLGDNQFISYDCNSEIAKQVQYGLYQQHPETDDKPEWVKVAEDVLDGEEE